MNKPALPHLLKRQITRHGYWVSRKTSVLHDRWAEEIHFDASFPIAHLLVQKSPLQFVQIGAFDGVSNDFLAPFVRRGLLQGLMVEPEPAAFAQLQANCGDRPGVRLVPLAVAKTNGSVKMYRVKREFWHLHEAAPQLTSLDPGNIRKWLAGRTPNPDDVMEGFDVRAVTFEQLLAEHGMTALDVLQIDTEGYDAEIIRMIPFERLRPTIINFEILNLSKSDTEAIYTLLMDRGYRLHESKVDCTAYLKSACVLE
jgi:FkbM family methyltransferase